MVVHCTHGVNRTGYFICRYMIQKMDIPPDNAVERFQEARGHTIERSNYVSDLVNGCKGGSEADVASMQGFQGKNKFKRRHPRNDVANPERPLYKERYSSPDRSNWRVKTEEEKAAFNENSSSIRRGGRRQRPPYNKRGRYYGNIPGATELWDLDTEKNFAPASQDLRYENCHEPLQDYSHRPHEPLQDYPHKPHEPIQDYSHRSHEPLHPYRPHEPLQDYSHRPQPQIDSYTQYMPQPRGPRGSSFYRPPVQNSCPRQESMALLPNYYRPPPPYQNEGEYTQSLQQGDFQSIRNVNPTMSNNLNFNKNEPFTSSAWIRKPTSYYGPPPVGLDCVAGQSSIGSHNQHLNVPSSSTNYLDRETNQNNFS